MGWSIGWDQEHDRDIGYGVPALCDHPKCNEEIDRGLSYVCGGQPYGGDIGCGLFFCGKHLSYVPDPYDTDPEVGDNVQLCNRCANKQPPFDPKPDILEWVNWKLTDESWQIWRDSHVEEVKLMLERVSHEQGQTAPRNKET
jgi:hypothetical protein